MPEPWLFGSFFLGGFEASSLRKARGRWLDSAVVTQHDVQAQEDYARCRPLGIRAVRETAVRPAGQRPKPWDARFGGTHPSQPRRARSLLE
jgi:hypothetical protein